MIKTIAALKNVKNNAFQEISPLFLKKLKDKVKTRPRNGILSFPKKKTLYYPKGMIYKAKKLEYPIIYNVIKMKSTSRNNGYMVYVLNPVPNYDKNQKPSKLPIYGRSYPAFDIFI